MGARGLEGCFPETREDGRRSARGVEATATASQPNRAIQRQAGQFARMVSLSAVSTCTLKREL